MNFSMLMWVIKYQGANAHNGSLQVALVKRWVENILSREPGWFANELMLPDPRGVRGGGVYNWLSPGTVAKAPVLITQNSTVVDYLYLVDMYFFFIFLKYLSLFFSISLWIHCYSQEFKIKIWKEAVLWVNVSCRLVVIIIYLINYWIKELYWKYRWVAIFILSNYKTTLWWWKLLQICFQCLNLGEMLVLHAMKAINEIPEMGQVVCPGSSVNMLVFVTGISPLFVNLYICFCHRGQSFVPAQPCGFKCRINVVFFQF